MQNVESIFKQILQILNVIWKYKKQKHCFKIYL